VKQFWILGLGALMAVMFLPTATRAADSPIAPYVGQTTNIIIHVDMTQIDMDAINAMCEKALAKNPPSDPVKAAKDQKDMEKGIAKAKKWIGDFETAGGKDLYIVVDLSNFMAGPGAMVIPLDAAADVPGLTKVINPNPRPVDPNGGPMQADTAVIGQTLVYSTTGMIQKLKAAPANTAHVDLMDGLAAANGSAFQLVLSPISVKNNPMLNMMMMQGMSRGNPNGPPPTPPLSEPVWNNVPWVLVSVTPPPKEAGGIICQCKDAASADDLQKLITSKMQQPPDKNDPMDPADAAKLKEIFKPTVSGTQVKMTVDQDTLDNVVIPIMIKTADRKQAQQHQPPPAPENMPPDSNNPGGPGGGAPGGGGGL
jgi:hypothetical protein